MMEPPSRHVQTGELADAYDEWYSQWDSGEAAELDYSLFSYHEAALEIAGEVFQGRSVLDAGCGDGRLTREVALRGAAEVVGIDISDVALRFAQRRASGLDTPVSFQRGDIEAIPTPEERFSVVFCCETIEHVLSPATAMGELRRVLVPGGTLILTTPNYLGLSGLHRLSVWVRGRRYSEGGQPVNNLTTWPRTALWVIRAGFRIDRLRTDRLLLPRRGAEPKEVSPPTPLDRFLRPFGQESVIRATRRA